MTQTDDHQSQPSQPSEASEADSPQEAPQTAEDVTSQDPLETAEQPQLQSEQPDDLDGPQSDDDQADQTDGNDTIDPAEMDEIAATVEAILFSVDEPISPSKIAQVAELPNRRIVKDAIALLNDRYEQMGCAFLIESIAGGFQMMTREEYHDVLARLLKVRSDSRLTNAALETLAVVAYRQPIIRADIESIRGVACGDMLRKLMDKNLVKITGRAEVLGRPMLYGTTMYFLEVFGLSSLEDLPNADQLKASARKQPSSSQDADADQSQEPQEDGASEASPIAEQEGSVDLEEGDSGKKGADYIAENDSSEASEESAESDDCDDSESA